MKRILQLTNIQFYNTQIDIWCVEIEKPNDTVRHYSYVYQYERKRLMLKRFTILPLVTRIIVPHTINTIIFDKDVVYNVCDILFARGLKIVC